MDSINKRLSNVVFYLALIILNLTIFTDLLPANTALKVISLVLLIVNLVIKRKTKLEFSKILYPLIVFSMFVIANVLFGGDTSYVITFIVNILILFLLIQFPEFSKAEVKIIMIICSIQLLFVVFAQIAPITLVNSLFSKIINYGYNVNYSWRNISGTNVGITKQPGVCAMYMVALSSYFFSKLMKEKKKLKYGVGYVLCIYAIVLTGKRAAMLFSIITVIIMFFMFKHDKLSSKKIINIATLGLITIVVVFVLNVHFGFLDGIIAKNRYLIANNDISNGRMDIWKDSLKLYLQNPLFGIGLKKYYALRGIDIHNTYLQYFVEMGIIGFFVFILCFGYLIKEIVDNCKRNYESGFSCMKESTIMGMYLLIFLMLYGFVGNTFIDYLPLSMFIISIGMLVSDVSKKEVK